VIPATGADGYVVVINDDVEDTIAHSGRVRAYLDCDSGSIGLQPKFIGDDLD